MTAGARRRREGWERVGREFLSPLWYGGAVRIDRPVPPAALTDLEALEPLDDESEAALARLCAELAPPARPLSIDRGTWAMVLAIYDLLSLTDPAMSRWGTRRARPVVRRWVRVLLRTAGHPATRMQALVRHALVERVASLERRDVLVRNWAGALRYDGRPVPSRVLAWPRVRRVRTEARSVGLRELLRRVDASFRLDLATLFDAWERRSPLTTLLRMPPNAFGRAELDVLGDGALRQGVAVALARRPDAMDLLASALDRLCSRSIPPEALARAEALAADVRWMVAEAEGRGVPA